MLENVLQKSLKSRFYPRTILLRQMHNKIHSGYQVHRRRPPISKPIDPEAVNCISEPCSNTFYWSCCTGQGVVQLIDWYLTWAIIMDQLYVACEASVLACRAISILSCAIVCSSRVTWSLSWFLHDIICTSKSQPKHNFPWQPSLLFSTFHYRQRISPYQSYGY